MPFVLYILLVCVCGHVSLFGTLHWHKEVNGKFSFEARFSSSKLTLEENLNIELLIKFPVGYELDVNSLRNNLLKFGGLSEPPFILIKEEKSSLPENGIKLHYVLEPQIPGTQLISFYNIPFTPKNPGQDVPVEIISDIFKVEVGFAPINPHFQPRISPLLSLTEAYPITIDAKNRINLVDSPQKNLEESKRNVSLLRLKTFPWPQFFGIVLFAIILMVIKFKPKNLEPEPISQTDQMQNAHQRGLQALAAIKKNTMKKQNFSEFYVLITDVVRDFVEERFQIKTSAKTTQEFLQEMAQYPNLDENTQILLSDFLQKSDRVKFAHHLPNSEEREEAYKAAENLINT